MKATRRRVDPVQGASLAGMLELVGFRVFADLRSERHRTYLGFVWWFVEPMLFMGVLVVLAEVIGIRGGPGFVPFLLSGLVLWQWYKSAISHAMTSIMQSAPLLRNVHVFPAIFPIVTVLSDTLKFLMVLAVLMVLLWAYGRVPHVTYAALPLVLLSQLVLISGISVLVAALVPFVPDLRFVISPVLQAQFFLSGIFYSFDRLPAEYREWVVINPMVVYIDASRAIVLEHRWPEATPILAWTAIGLVLLVAGILLTRRLAPHFAKIPA